MEEKAEIKKQQEINKQVLEDSIKKHEEINRDELQQQMTRQKKGR